MIGVTGGGGIGRFQGVNGLMIDSLLSVRLVTANGKILDVSEDSNPDLFWALRGATPNFGIITSATYRLHEPTNGGQIFSADFILPASANASYFDILQGLEGTIPAELSAITILGYNTTTDEVSTPNLSSEDSSNLPPLTPITAPDHRRVGLPWAR